jgi:hypothetical protein
MPRGTGWELHTPGGNARFKATLITRKTIGNAEIASFKIVPHPEK